MNKNSIIKCRSCKYKGKLLQFVSGMGSLLVCPQCGNNFYPPIVRKKTKKWLKFLLLEKGKKTNLWRVENKNGLILGFIRWYSQWRQYCFISNGCDNYNVIYSQSCLRDIADFIKEQMNKRKKHYCGECEFRDYGTDSHYVCQENQNWFRIRKDSPACPKFKRKE